MHSMRVTYTTHLILLYIIIFGEKYKLWSFSLWNFLQPPTISSLLISWSSKNTSSFAYVCFFLGYHDSCLNVAIQFYILSLSRHPDTKKSAEEIWRNSKHSFLYRKMKRVYIKSILANNGPIYFVHWQMSLKGMARGKSVQISSKITGIPLLK
jgi:hypothetical protein